MVLSLNNQTICTSDATYDDKTGVISSMGTCAPMLPVKRGDYISMASVYDLKKHPMRKGVDGKEAHNVMGGMDLMGMWTMTYAMNNSYSNA